MDNSEEKIKKIASLIDDAEFKSHVWKKSFEEDNFGGEIIKFVNSYLNKVGKPLRKKRDN